MKYLWVGGVSVVNTLTQTHRDGRILENEVLILLVRFKPDQNTFSLLFFVVVQFRFKVDRDIK